MTSAKIHLSTITVVLSAIVAFANGPVTQYGRLVRDGNRIVSAETGDTVQLKGVSTQWSSTGWGSDAFFRGESVDAMVEGWNARVIRSSLGISFNKGANHFVNDGYDVTPDSNWARVKRVVDAAIARDIYVIIDWHSHTAHDPDETELAIRFFTDEGLAGQYGSHPAVIFEIYNEPENDVTWPEVKAYADTVIGAIREKGFNNLILVGNPRWTSQPHVAAANPPVDPEGNIAMAFHFYTVGYPIGSYRSSVQGALDLGFPVFVTEWGTNDASTGGSLDLLGTDRWHSYLDSNKISSCAWGIMAGNGNVLYFWTQAGNPLASADPANTANWIDPAGMTPHGRYVYHWLTGNDTSWVQDVDFPPFTGKRSPLWVNGEAVNWVTTENTSTEGNTLTNFEIEDNVLTFTYTLVKGNYQYTPYAGIGFETGSLARCEYGIGYTYKGGDHSLRVEQDNVANWAYHINSRKTGDTGEWTTVDIPWHYFQQPSWNTVPVAIAPSEIEWIRWYKEAASGSGEILIKDVWCLGDENGEVLSIRRDRPRESVAASSLRVIGRTLQVRMAESGRVDIFDVKGKRIRTMELAKGDHSITMSGLPKGMYVVRANSGPAVKMHVK